MRLFILSVIFSLSSLTAFPQSWTLKDVDIYRSFDDFEHILDTQNDTTYLVNFWATWCAPCVKELPHFGDIQKLSKGKKLKVVLVSLDFERQFESRLIPFLNKNKIASDVVVLLDKKESTWIDKVDPEWSGAIPITLVYKGEKRNFYEKSFHSTDELKSILKPYLNI